MRVRLILACAIAGIAGTALGVSTANAEGTFTGSIGFSSDVVRPGDNVDVIGTCDDPAFTTAPIVSAILTAPDLGLHDDGAGGRVGVSVARVKEDATPEIWPVTFQCGTTAVTGYLRVAATAAPEPYSAIGIQDRDIKPGQEVLVVASCQTPDFTSSKVSSPVLTVPGLRRRDGDPANTPLTATGKINKTARPGSYPLSFTCAGKTVTGTFTVTGAAAPARPAAQAAEPPATPSQTPQAEPVDAPQPAASPDSETSYAIPLLLAAGAAVLLAAAGAGGWLYRKRRA